MDPSHPAPGRHEARSASRRIGRRDAIGVIGAASAALALAPADSANEPATRSAPVTVTCLIRYEIDPYQQDAFKEYAQRWGRIIPRCGGHLVGYFVPHEGTNDIAWALIAFDSLASYEAYRTRLRADPEGRDNFALAQTKRFILREERTFVAAVDGTFEVPARPVP